MNNHMAKSLVRGKPLVESPQTRFDEGKTEPVVTPKSSRFAKLFVAVVGVCLCLCGKAASQIYLVNGKYYGPDVYWNVTLTAGSAGSLFGDTLGPVRTFRYETVVTVDGWETKVIPGGKYSTDMPDSSYSVKISLKDLGLLEPEACGMHYLTAFTRSYEGDSTVDIGYSLVTEDISLTISLLESPKLEELKVEGIELPKDHVSTKTKGTSERFLVAGHSAEADVKVLNFDAEYYSLKSAVLIGTPRGVATQAHRYEGGVLQCSGSGDDVISFHPTLGEGRGLHGEYTWKVMAVFVCTIDGSESESESFVVDEPVFFRKNKKDYDGNPNWFTYWKEDGACPCLRTSSPAIRINNGLGNSTWGVYDAANGDISLSPVLAADKHYLKTFKVESPQCHEFSGPHIWGIYTVEEVVAHESSHEKLYTSYYADGKGWGRLFSDSDRHEPRKYFESATIVKLSGGMSSLASVQPIKLEYCDHLFNEQEVNDYKQYGLNKLTCDTYNLGKKKGSQFYLIEGEVLSEYAAYGDDEFLAMMAANKATDEKRAVPANDWAFPGEQSCVPADVDEARKLVGWPEIRRGCSAQLNAQVKVTGMEQAQNIRALAKVDDTTLSIAVNGMSMEIEYDGQPSYISAVCYKFDMNVSGVKDLRLTGVMTDLDGNIVSYASAAVSTGNVTAELRFQGNEIYESRRKGPFRLDSVRFVAFDGIDFSELATLNEFKDAEVNLERGNFIRKDAYLLTVEDETVTVRGIVVPVDVEINTPGEYELLAELSDTNGVRVASNNMIMNCSEGTNRLYMTFSASEILESDIDGPYVVSDITLLKNGIRMDARLNFRTLHKKYIAHEFDFGDGTNFDAEVFMSQFEDYTPPDKLPQSERFWVFFNPNGGSVSETTREVIGGEKVGTLPIPTLENDDFLGWYTELDGGTRITDSTIVTKNMMCHARWKNGGGSEGQGEGNVATEYGLYGSVVGNVSGTAASTYDGYLRDANGNVKGTILVKVGKPNAKTGLAAVKATVIGLDGMKKNLKASGNGKAAIDANGPTAVSLAGGETCSVTLGAKGLSGTYGRYAIDGSLNVFTSKDAADKAAATAALGKWQGAVNVAWQGAQGWNGLSVTIAAKGKAKVSGTLANGVKVSAKGQLIVGEEWCCVPVVVSKKAQLAFNVWLPKVQGGGALPTVAGIAGAVVGKPGTLKGGATFRLGAAMGDAKYNAYLPDGLAVGGGAKWTLPAAGKVQLAKDGAVDASKLGENPSALKLTYKAKDGTFKGSFKAYADANGKPKATTVKVAGVLVNGVGYGTASVKGGGAPVTVE